MDIEDQRVISSKKRELLVRLPDYREYADFLRIMKKDYKIHRVGTADEMYECMCGPRDHIAAVVVDAKRALAAGFAMHKKINADMRFAAIPTIAVTNEPDDDDCRRCLKAGCSEYISLPNLKSALRVRVNNAIKSKDSATFSEIEQMLMQLPSNIYLKDSEGKYVFATHYWHHLNQAGDPEWTIRGKTDLEIRKDKDNARLALESDKRMLETGEGTNYIIEEDNNGVKEYLELIKRPVFDKDGHVNGIIALINNVTEHQLLKMELEERSRRDELTGLLNKSATTDLIRRVLENTSDSEHAALMMVDVDKFKDINDTFGHATGDRVLTAIGLIIFKTIKGMDIGGRFGGDEFMILLRDIEDEETAIRLARRLNEAVVGFYEGDKLGDYVTLSIGISLFPKHGETFDELFEAADRAMYYVKQHGRNYQLLYNPDLMSEETPDNGND